MSEIRFYNTLSNKVEVFEPIKEGKVGLYSCGPTVYSHAHIGNYRAFLMADLLKRFFEFEGFEVTHIMNITDVGHLLDDADEGADKLEEEARRQKKDPLEIAKIYIDSFMTSNELLNMKPADHYPAATKHIPEMITIIEKLIDKGYAYVVGNNVYYDVTKFANYGKLSGNTLDELNDGARIEVNKEKRNAQDFALWKSDRQHLQQWDSPWGKGFPGWHIECSAMSSKYLGDEFDIHTGGEDNIFPHHECEIAQSEGASGRKFVHYWIHARFLLFDGEKMSKSKGNLYTISQLIDKGFGKNAIRYALISSHYRQNYNFTFEGLNAAQQAIDKIQQCIFALENKAAGSDGEVSENVCKLNADVLAGFEEALCDDLNISKALGSVFDFVREVNKLEEVRQADFEAVVNTFDRLDSVLGVLEKRTVDIPAEIIEKAEKRKEAKANKDWPGADAMRDEITAAGFLVEDTPGGYRIKRK